jgi:hypothetical protein
MLGDEEVLSPKLADRVEKDYRTMLPFVRWLNRALGYREAEKR